MTHNSDYADIHKLLAELPEVALPDSLRADALFARMDAQQSSDDAPATTRKSNIVSLTRRLRPVLSYAAVFAVLVLVYYGAGVDKMSTAPAPAAAPGLEMAAATAPEASAAPMMAMDNDNSSSTAAEAQQMENENAKIAPQVSANDGEALPENAPRTMSVASKLVAEVDFGELRATICQLDSAVVISIANLSDPLSVLHTVTQDGNYTYTGKVTSGDTTQLLMATLTAADVQPANVDTLHNYPSSDNDRYMVFTLLDGSSGVPSASAAVHGSNLILQEVSSNTFVVFSDAKQDAAAVGKINLGSATIELR